MSRLRALIHEVHRRSLWQVLGIYLGGSWLMYQVIVTLTQGIGLPAWVPGFTVVLFLIGLPIVVATAFVQEGHPLSRPQQPAPEQGGDSRRVGRPAEPGPAALPGAGAPSLGAPSLAASDDPASSGDPASPSGTAPSSDRPHRTVLRRQLTWARALAAGVLAFALLALGTGGYMGLRVAGIGPGGSLRGAGEIVDGDLLVLADFGNTTADTVLGMVVTEALRVDLHQARVIALADPARVEDVLRRMARERGAALDEALALEIVQRDGMRGVVAGEIAPLGAGYAMTSRIVAADGRVLAMFRETARDEDDLVAAVDRLSRKMRTRLGDSYRQLHATPPLERVTTSSFEALRRYTQAERMGGGDEAVALLEEAIALDPEFAMAYRKLRAFLNNMGVKRGRALEASIAMYQHRDRLTEVERGLAEGDYHWAVTRDYARAVQGYRAALRANPHQPSAHNNLPAVLHLLRQFDAAAEAAEAGLADGTAYPSLPWNLALIRFSQRDTLAARAVMDSLAATGHWFYPALWGLAESVSLGHLDRADSIAASLMGRNPRMGRDAQEVRAAVALQRGRLGDAERIVEEFSAIAIAAGLHAEALLFRLHVADALAAQIASPDQVADRIDAALAATPLEELEPLERPYPELAALYARIGYTDQARHWLDRWLEVTPAEARVRPPFNIEVARARIALHEGRPANALRHLRDADRNFEDPVTFLADMGVTFEALAQPDSAIAAFERFLTDPSLGRYVEDGVARPGVLLRLAALYEARGDRDNARAYYARYLELQGEPDPVLRPRVEEMRRRLAALSNA